MSVCERIPLFKWFKITWEDGYFCLAQSKEKLIITNKSIKFTREPIHNFAYEEYGTYDKCKWSFSTDDDYYEEKLNILCIYFLNHKEKFHKINGCDTPIFTIEVKRYDGEIIKDHYCFDMKTNEMDKLIEYIMEYIPKNAQKPYFIEGYPLDDKE